MVPIRARIVAWCLPDIHALLATNTKHVSAIDLCFNVVGTSRIHWRADILCTYVNA